jgi:hypothetical protein
VKKTAWIVIVSLVMSSTPTWAEKASTIVECHVYDGRLGFVTVPVTQEQWDQMPPSEQATMCFASQSRQKVKTGEWLSPKLAATGAITGLLGALMLLPHGTEYHILGDPYCVSTYSVDYGGCGPGVTVAQVGLIALGSGILMAYIGTRPKTRTVTVSPTLSPTTLGASATIRWGGRNVK